MKIKDLIEKLEKLNSPDEEILIWGQIDGMEEGIGISSIGRDVTGVPYLTVDI